MARSRIASGCRWRSGSGERATSRGWRRRGIAAAAIVALAGVALAMAGDLDATFGVGGIVDVALPGDPNWLGVDCEVRSDGRIVLAGSDEVGVPYRRWAIRSFHAGGSVDTSFGTDGMVTVFGAGSDDNLNDITLDGSGRILAVGNGSVVTVNPRNGRKTTQFGAALARITADGALDSSFGSGGTVLTQVSGASSTVARAVAAQPDGKIVVAGTAHFNVKGKGGTSPNAAIYLARYLSDGSLDGTFGSGGIAVHDRTSGADYLAGGTIGIQSDGEIVVGSKSSGSLGADDWVITRYLANGAVDTGFGTITSLDDTLLGLSVDADDRIVAVGLRELGVNVSDMVVTRYAASGALDTSFGSGGTTLIDLDVYETLRCPRFQSDGKIVCSGIVVPDPSTGHDHGIVLRLLANGTLDGGFGAGGIAGPIQLSTTFTEPFALDLAPDGGIVVAGRYDDGDPHWFLARYLAE